MATNHYSGDSPYNPHPPLLTAAGRCMPPDRVAYTGPAVPPHDAGVSITSITRS